MKHTDCKMCLPSTSSVIILTVIVSVILTLLVQHWLQGHSKPDFEYEDYKVENNNHNLKEAQEKMEKVIDDMKKQNQRVLESASVNASRRTESMIVHNRELMEQNAENRRKAMEQIEKIYESANKEGQKNQAAFIEQNRKILTSGYTNEMLLEYDEDPKGKGNTSRWSLF